MATHSRLELVRAVRVGGGGRTAREYIDFVIDGVPLRGRITADVITPLGWGVPAEQGTAIGRLLRQAEPDLPGMRCSLYVCPECGELGCGAVGVVIDRGDGAIVWRDFAWQLPASGAAPEETKLDLGPFSFEGLAYVRLFDEMRSQLGPWGRLTTG